MMESCIRLSGDLLLLDLAVQPGASRSEPRGIRQGRLTVRIAAAPEDGKANRELITWLSKTLECPRKDIILKTGEKSRLKTLVVPRDKKARLEELLSYWRKGV